MSRVTKIPAIPPKLNDRFARLVSELTGVWRGEKGNRLDRLVSVRDLKDAGVISLSSDPSQPEVIEYVNPEDTVVPGNPTSLAAAVVTLTSVALAWTTRFGARQRLRSTVARSVLVRLAPTCTPTRWARQVQLITIGSAQYPLRALIARTTQPLA